MRAEVLIDHPRHSLRGGRVVASLVVVACALWCVFARGLEARAGDVDAGPTTSLRVVPA